LWFLLLGLSIFFLMRWRHLRRRQRWAQMG
jgi:hypothetical protein